MGILNRTKGAINWFRTKQGLSNEEAQKVINLYKEEYPLKLGQSFTNRLDFEKEIEYQKQFNRMCSWFIRNKEDILEKIRKKTTVRIRLSAGN